jgi:predicted nicotinamide N-methyase
VTSAQFVLSATRLASVPFVPEIRLHQVPDIYALWEQTEREAGRAGLDPPFWAVAWPGGRALARYLLDHPAVVAGRSVLDLCSGSGLVAIAAAMAGAVTVTASETAPLATTAIELNAAANGVAAPDCVGDVLGSSVTSAEVVVAGDVWYERELAARAGAYLDQAAAAGAHVLTGDIGRSYFPRDRYRHVASYDLPASKALEGREVLRASVWQVIPAAGRS